MRPGSPIRELLDRFTGHAAALIEGLMTRERVDGLVRSRASTTANLARPLPVDLAYFMAVAKSKGEIEFLPDIYDPNGQIAPAGGTSADS